MRELVAIMKALADESRLRILWAVHGRELCLCQIVELLGLATSTVSKHLSILKQAQLVDARKEGRWTYFQVAGAEAPPEARQAAALVVKSLSEDAETSAYAKRLARILKIDREELCRRQNECRS